MAQGTIFDFLQLATENDDLRAELVALAAKHGFTFAAAELADDDLADVAGGVVMDNGSARMFDSSTLAGRLKVLDGFSKILGVEPTTFPAPPPTIKK